VDEFLQEGAVEVAADRVVDEALLVLRLVSRLVSEHHIIVPPPLDLQTRTEVSVNDYQ
jgi:hypothetical protein